MPTILVADDNSNIQKMVTLAFKGEGIDVVAVGNGEAAVKKAIEIVPDLVLADIFMPVRSGYEVCEFLKQDSRFSHIPVVLLAGAFDPFDEREAQRVGADGVLKKPFVPPDPLVSLVKGLLAKNAERLVAVAVPVQTNAISAQSSTATSEASVASAPAFIPPSFSLPPSPDPSVQEEEYPDDDIDLATTATPMRDFSIPVAPVESAHHGGSDAFGSMLDTSPLGTMMPPMRKLGEPETEEEVGADRDIQPASAHTAFEGFSPWRASASSAGVVDEEETSQQAPQKAPEQAPEPAAEEENQIMPSPKDLMGRVWEIDPSLMDQSPDETVIEPLAVISPLTHSAQHVTTVREEQEMAAETFAVVESNDVSDVSSVHEADASGEGSATAEPEPAKNSGASDWRSTIAQVPEEAAQILETPAASMSPWRMSTPPAETFQSDRLSDASAIAEVSSVEETSSAPQTETASDPQIENAPISFSEHVAESHQNEIAENDSATDSASFTNQDAELAASSDESVSASAPEIAEPAAEEYSHIEAPASESQESASPDASQNIESSDWIASLPAHLSPEDTTSIARSVVEQLAPHAVESMASSFPVPTSATSDPRVVEDIVARVVERMQPQILEMITREVLRPVVEALVRRQLEQKSHE